jgi:hypothetical protein
VTKYPPISLDWIVCDTRLRKLILAPSPRPWNTPPCRPMLTSSHELLHPPPVSELERVSVPVAPRTLSHLAAPPQGSCDYPHRLPEGRKRSWGHGIQSLWIRIRVQKRWIVLVTVSGFFSGCPNQETGRTFLFKGLTIGSYFATLVRIPPPRTKWSWFRWECCIYMQGCAKAYRSPVYIFVFIRIQYVFIRINTYSIRRIYIGLDTNRTTL